MNKRIRVAEIRQKLREIEDSLSVVEENLPSDFKDFKALGLIKDGIYKKLEFAIENVIDICNILNSDLSLGVPSDDEGIISNLEANKILDMSVIGKLRTMKGFRNILVHKYGRIDDELAFYVLQNNLGDFKDFEGSVLRFLELKKGSK